MNKAKKTAKKFSTSWKSSKRPVKQRRYSRNAPLHTKHKFLNVHLSKDLRKKHSVRSLPVVKGDKVKVVRGQHKKRENKVERVDIKKGRVYITGIDFTKKDGSKSLYSFKPSNLLLQELNLEDKNRKAVLARKAAKGKTPRQEKTVKTEEEKTKTAEGAVGEKGE